MAWRRDARVAETSTTTGTGDITLAGAYDASYRAFSAVCSTNDKFRYVIVASGGAWERGIGTYSGANTLTRTTVRESSNSNNAVSFTGTLTVFMDEGAPDIHENAKTGAYTVALTDYGQVIDMTSGTWTLALTAAATLGDGFWFCTRNSGTGDITIDPNASETIDGVTSFVSYPSEARLIWCDGTSFYSIIEHPFFRTFSASGTFSKPPGYNLFGADLCAAGGGGGGGATPGASAKGGNGGAGGATRILFRTPSQLSANETITCGSGGTAGAVNGTGGTGGNTTAFGVTVYGGGAGGPNGNPGASGGWLNAGSGTTAGAGTLYGGLTANLYDGGVAGATTLATVWGGAPGGVGTTGAGASPTALTRFGGGGGGAGGGVTGGVGSAGAAGSAPDGLVGGAGGTTGSTAGTSPTTQRQGGGGAASNAAGTAGGTGGTGGPGGGGGGGGGGSTSSGGGGVGGAGFVNVWGIV